MKHLKLAMICLCFALTTMVMTEAEAGRTKKPTKGSRTEKTEEETQPRRFDNLPTMSFLGGTLSRSIHTGWKIGETPLSFHEDCVITTEGDEVGMLEEGRKAVVMGSRVGGTIIAWSIHVSQPAYKMTGIRQSSESKEVGPNPNVGKIINPVE